MSNKSENKTLNMFRSCRPVGRVKACRLPETERGSRTNVRDCGPKLLGSLATFDPTSFVWKTPQTLLVSTTGKSFQEFSAIWPRSVLILCRTAFPLNPSARLTAGIVGFAWHGNHFNEFPTPTASRYGSSGNGKGNNKASRGRLSLRQMAARQMWPTPIASDSNQYPTNSLSLLIQTGSKKRIGNGSEACSGEQCNNRKFWPTATKGDSKGSGSRNTTTSRAHAGESLTDAVLGDKGEGRRKTKMRLSPDWVELLMGYPPGFTDIGSGIGKEGSRE